MPVKLIAHALIEKNGKYLLIKRSKIKRGEPNMYPEYWDIPGGAMELGESTLDTAKREFFEETGIEVEATRFLNVYSNFEEVYPNGDAVQTVVFIYELAAISSVNIADFHNEETLRLRFFSKEEIENLESVSSKHRLMLAEYFDDNFAMGH